MGKSMGMEHEKDQTTPIANQAIIYIINETEHDSQKLSRSLTPFGTHTHKMFQLVHFSHNAKQLFVLNEFTVVGDAFDAAAFATTAVAAD